MDIILDRDGVINYDSDNYIRTPDEWLAIPGSLEAIVKLKQANRKVFVMTNQAGIAKGVFDNHTLEAIHTKMSSSLFQKGAEFDGIYHCPHADSDQCNCRKPKPGMLYDIANEHSCNLEQTIVIGDQFRDLEAGIAAGCKPILVLTGKGKTTLRQHTEQLQNIPVYENLANAVDAILEQ